MALRGELALDEAKDLDEVAPRAEPGREPTGEALRTAPQRFVNR